MFNTSIFCRKAGAPESRIITGFASEFPLGNGIRPSDGTHFGKIATSA
jgi:hypothetical protein